MQKRRKPADQKRRMIIITVSVILFSIVTLVTSRSSSTIEMIIKDTIANIEYYVIKAPIQYVNGLFSEYSELKNVYQENALLKQKLDDLARESALNDVLTSEINQLKELTNIKFLPTDYKIKYTKVISRDAKNWSNEVTIDIGSLAGIKEGMAVINSQGMIGTITNTSDISATVTLLSSEKPLNQLPVMIISGGKEYFGLLNRYDFDKKGYTVSLLSNVEGLEKGAQVLTSGLGGQGKSPKGILIGTVAGFSAGEETGDSICTVTPSVQFDSLQYIAVVQRVSE